MMNKVVDNYILLDKLGAGQFAEVFKGKDRLNDMNVAVKVYSLQKFLSTPKLKEMILNEIKALQDLNNNNIIHFYKMLKTTNNIYLVYEFCDSHTLEDYIINRKFLSEKEALGFMKQLSNAFKDMQSKNIIHRDIKPSNILLTSNGALKVADFGLCKFLDAEQEQREKLENIINHAIEKTVIVGSPIYMAPELLKGHQLHRKIDIYSLGILFYEMLFGVCPFEDSNVENLIKKIESGSLNFPLDRNNISLRTQGFIRELLRPDPTLRIDWDRFFSFFDEITDDFNVRNFGFLEKKNSGYDDRTKPKDPPQFSTTFDRGESFPLQFEPGFKTEPTKLDVFSTKQETFQPKLDMFSKGESTSKPLSFILTSKKLLKEKNKTLYLSNIINAALDLNLNSLTVLAVMALLRQQTLVYEGILDILYQELPKENHLQLLKLGYEDWIRYKRSEDHRVFSRLCHEELIIVKENLINFFKIAQNEKKTLELRYFELKREEINEVLFYYCKTVHAHALLLLSEQETDLAKKILIHANNILDAMGLEEFFEKLINEEVLKIDEQSYFSKMLGFPVAKYLRLVDEKLGFFAKTLGKMV